jgi:hypothetical protein
MNRIYFPFLNSIKFVEEDATLTPQYDKPLFDYSLMSEQLFGWQEKKCYTLKKTIYDADSLQFVANFDPIQIDVYDNSDDHVVFSLAAQRIRRNSYQPDFFIYEVDISYADLDPGKYYMKLTAGSTKVFISELIEVLPSVENTVYLEYANSEYYGDVIFETDITMKMRVEGVVTNFTPGTKSVVYEDQVLNNTTLSFVPFRTWKLFIGGTFGIPAYIIDKVNRILGCDNLMVNGKAMSIADGAKWEEHAIDNYPFSGWSIDMREALNRNSTVFDTETSNDKKLIVVHNIESKGFGDLSENEGSNIVVITNIE